MEKFYGAHTLLTSKSFKGSLFVRAEVFDSQLTSVDLRRKSEVCVCTVRSECMEVVILFLATNKRWQF